MIDIIDIKKIKDDIFLSVKKSLEIGEREYEFKEEFFKRVYEIKEEINNRVDKPIIYDWVQYQRKSLKEYIYDNLIDIRYKFTTKIDLLPMYNRDSIFKDNTLIELNKLCEEIESRFDETIKTFAYNKKNNTITKIQKLTLSDNNIRINMN